MKKRKQLIVALFFLMILIPIGFYSKLYSGYGHEWVNNRLGGVFYEMFWCLVFYILFPKIKVFKIALTVCLITCLLEFAQLLNNDFLDIIRSNFIGQTIFGNSFTWNDFPYYFIGSFLGFLLLKLTNKIK